MLNHSIKYAVLIILLQISLNAVAQDSMLINRAISQLNLDQSKIDIGLTCSKVRPNNADETILIIAIIAIDNEDRFELDGYILIVNTKTGKIINKQYETSKMNGWVSDAVILSDIKIDTAPYNISEQDRAFGVRVRYHTLSQPNPYSNEVISLYIPESDSLKKVLDYYEVMNYGGEWDMECYGEFSGEDKVLIISEEKTNGYYDIIVKNTITDTESGRDKNGECISFDKISIAHSIFRFDGMEYK